MPNFPVQGKHVEIFAVFFRMQRLITRKGIIFAEFLSMKQESQPLISFIEDHGLQKPNGAICFLARIYFNSEKTILKFTSSVHVVTISAKHLDIVYLLNPEIDAAKINTMYSNNKRFHYSNTKRFHIKGRSKFYGRYSIFINPISKNCETDTIAEIHAKIHN